MTSNGITPPRQTANQYPWQMLIEFDLSTEPGSEHVAAERVAGAMQKLNWPAAHLEQLKLALAQAARKAMETSRRYDSEASLVIRVLFPENEPAPRDAGPAHAESTRPKVADRQAQPVGQPPSRGWSFFLIEKALPETGGVGQHLLEVFLYPGR